MSGSPSYSRASFLSKRFHTKLNLASPPFCDEYIFEECIKLLADVWQLQFHLTLSIFFPIPVKLALPVQTTVNSVNILCYSKDSVFVHTIK